MTQSAFLETRAQMREDFETAVMQSIVEVQVKRISSSSWRAFFSAVAAVAAQRPAFEPITDKTLLNPAPDDWLMYSRTYDAQRFSPLKQITRQNVGAAEGSLQDRVRPGGQQESIPLVYRGVMYVVRAAERDPRDRRDDRRRRSGSTSGRPAQRASRRSRCTTTWSTGRRRTAHRAGARREDRRGPLGDEDRPAA